MSKTTLQVRLYPTPEQAHLLMTHCQEYIRTVNVLVAAFASAVLTGKVSTKDFTAMLPSAVKNQALRDAQSIFKRSFELGCIPLLKKPISELAC
jgi:putative transposase